MEDTGKQSSGLPFLKTPGPDNTNVALYLTFRVQIIPSLSILNQRIHFILCIIMFLLT